MVARPLTGSGSAGPNGRVTRTDLESKLRQIQGEAETAGESAKSAGLVIGGVVGVVFVAAAFLFGKRRGNRKQTVVEIRRV